MMKRKLFLKERGRPGRSRGEGLGALELAESQRKPVVAVPGDGHAPDGQTLVRRPRGVAVPGHSNSIQPVAIDWLKTQESPKVLGRWNKPQRQDNFVVAVPGDGHAPKPGRRAGDSAPYLKACVLLVSLWACLSVRSAALYQNNFEQSEIGKAPDDFLILEGGFAVKEEGGNRFLELPGAPLDSFAALFGPTESSNLVVSAVIQGTGKGRRYPTLGVGLNGVAGYKLQVSPAKNVLEIYRDQQSKASIPFEWKSGEWINLKLQVVSAKAGEWRVEGKAWLKGATEPESWMIRVDEKEPPPSGRPSVFGSPFSGTPIKFDDLVVQAVEK